MKISGVIPSGVEEQWYLKNFINPTIQTICSFPIIQTSTGHFLELPKVIIPEVTYSTVPDKNGQQKISVEEPKLLSLWAILKEVHDNGQN